MNDSLTYRLVRAIFPTFDYAISHCRRSAGRPWIDRGRVDDPNGVSYWLRLGSKEIVVSLERQA